MIDVGLINKLPLTPTFMLSQLSYLQTEIKNKLDEKFFELDHLTNSGSPLVQNEDILVLIYLARLFELLPK